MLAWKRTPLTQALGFLPPRLPGPPPPPRTLSSQATVPRGAIGPPQRLRSYSHALTGQGKSWEHFRYHLLPFEEGVKERKVYKLEQSPYCFFLPHFINNCTGKMTRGKVNNSYYIAAS